MKTPLEPKVSGATPRTNVARLLTQSSLWEETGQHLTSGHIHLDPNHNLDEYVTVDLGASRKVIPMARVPGKVNYTKLVHQANKTKSKVKKSQIEAYAKWQKKLGKKSNKLDALDAKLRKVLKEIEAAEESRKDNQKALQRYLRMVEGAFKELQIYKQVPVHGKVPQPPKNIIALNSLSIVVVGMIVYLAAIKSYMALSEALSTKDA